MSFLNINNKFRKKLKLGYYLEKIISGNTLIQLGVLYLLFFIVFDIIAENYLKKNKIKR